MSFDTEQKDQTPVKKRFWSNLFHSRSLRRNFRLQKSFSWHINTDPPPVQPVHPIQTPIQPPVQSSVPPSARPLGVPVRAQTQVRQQNTTPVQKHSHLPVRRATHSHSKSSVVGRGTPPAPSASVKRKQRADAIEGRSQISIPLGPLTEWPPWGVPKTAELPLSSAMELIARGTPIFNGHKREVPHAPDDYYMLYTTSSGNQPSPTVNGGSSVGKRSRDRIDRTLSRNSSRNSNRRSDRDVSRGGGSSASGLDDDTDAADLHDSMIELMTMRTTQTPGSSSRPAIYPWETLEQPSFAFCTGRRAGTITLNRWATRSSMMPPTIALRDSGLRPRDIDLIEICQRLRELQRDGLDESNEDRMYRNLYRRLLRDPDRTYSPRRTLDKQITDLIMALSRPDYWIDFNIARNQIVTRFIFDTSLANHQQYVRFFTQLLLSMELDLRICSRHHNDWAKEKLMLQLPPTLQYDLALARRWREYVRIDNYGKTADQVKLRFKAKSRQIRVLRRFARAMKWPNLAATVSHLKQRDADGTLESISSHAMAFFSGLILPGPSYPFAIMNALIDVDPDRATDDLAMLTHLHPNCGFQYRNSYTYWTSTCIVGKVLAPTCRELGGWVGPARPCVDLGRSQIARIRSRRSRQRLPLEDVLSMNERSDPLGPTSEVFPVADYKLVSTDATDIIDTVRIELISLRPTMTPSSETLSTPKSPPPTNGTPSSPLWFDASVQFAIDGVSWPMRLNFDVSFVCAWPCSNGPHPLFFDYVFSVIKADMVVDVHDWATPGGNEAENGPISSRTTSPSVHFGNTRVLGPQFPPVSKDGDDDKVLVIEAFGVPDNEVLARAWCAHWGLSAIVADVNKTCMACAIREAYAATLTVVILVDGQTNNNNDD